jgi:hypothetical protein
MSIDEILNFAVPAILLIVVIAFLFKWLREPLGELFGWIGDMFRSGKEKTQDRFTKGGGDFSYYPV